MRHRPRTRLWALGCRRCLSDFKSTTRTCDLPVPTWVAKLDVSSCKFGLENARTLTRNPPARVLCRTLRRRLAQIDDSWMEDPLPGSISRWGYTDDIDLRLSQHTKIVNSNYLMNPLHAIRLALGIPYELFQFSANHIPCRDVVELPKIHHEDRSRILLERRRLTPRWDRPLKQLQVHVHGRRVGWVLENMPWRSLRCSRTSKMSTKQRVIELLVKNKATNYLKRRISRRALWIKESEGDWSCLTFDWREHRGEADGHG